MAEQVGTLAVLARWCEFNSRDLNTCERRGPTLYVYPLVSMCSMCPTYISIQFRNTIVHYYYYYY